MVSLPKVAKGVRKVAEEITDDLLGTQDSIPRWDKVVEVRNTLDDVELYRMRPDGTLVRVSRPRRKDVDSLLLTDEEKARMDRIKGARSTDERITRALAEERITRDQLSPMIDDHLSDITGKPLPEVRARQRLEDASPDPVGDAQTYQKTRTLKT